MMARVGSLVCIALIVHVLGNSGAAAATPMQIIKHEHVILKNSHVEETQKSFRAKRDGEQSSSHQDELWKQLHAPSKHPRKLMFTGDLDDKNIYGLQNLRNSVPPYVMTQRPRAEQITYDHHDNSHLKMSVKGTANSTFSKVSPKASIQDSITPTRNESGGEIPQLSPERNSGLLPEGKTPANPKTPTHYLVLENEGKKHQAESSKRNGSPQSNILLENEGVEKENQNIAPFLKFEMDNIKNHVKGVKLNRTTSGPLTPPTQGQKTNTDKRQELLNPLVNLQEELYGIFVPLLKEEITVKQRSEISPNSSFALEDPQLKNIHPQPKSTLLSPIIAMGFSFFSMLAFLGVFATFLFSTFFNHNLNLTPFQVLNPIPDIGRSDLTYPFEFQLPGFPFVRRKLGKNKEINLSRHRQFYPFFSEPLFNGFRLLEKVKEKAGNYF